MVLVCFGCFFFVFVFVLKQMVLDVLSQVMVISASFFPLLCQTLNNLDFSAGPHPGSDLWLLLSSLASQSSSQSILEKG